VFVTRVTVARTVPVVVRTQALVVLYNPAAVADKTLPHAPVSTLSQFRCMDPTPLAITSAFQ